MAGYPQTLGVTPRLGVPGLPPRCQELSTQKGSTVSWSDLGLGPSLSVQIPALAPTCWVTMLYICVSLFPHLSNESPTSNSRRGLLWG